MLVPKYFRFNVGSLLRTQLHRFPLNNGLTQMRAMSDGNNQVPDQPMESTAPNSAWPEEAVQLYHKLNAGTSNGEWEKLYREVPKGEIRAYMRATGDKMIAGAFFFCRSKQIAKGGLTFGPWCEGGAPGHVHGGAIATAHDSITGVLAGYLHGPCVTASLTTNFRRLLPLLTTTLLTAKVDAVEGRKIFLTSKIMSPDEKYVYGDASAIYIVLGGKE